MSSDKVIRPQSAPALLRNEEPGLIVQKTHEECRELYDLAYMTSMSLQDSLRQHLEDFAVADRLCWLKREGRTKRAPCKEHVGHETARL